MKRSITTRFLILASSLAAIAAGPSFAEVRAVQQGSQGWRVEIEAAEGGRVWTPLTPHSYDEQVLNPSGDLFAHGRPAVGVRPTVGLPEAVYAKMSPQGYHLELAQHDGEGWTRFSHVGRTPGASDTNPVISYDESGRSMLLWQRSVNNWAVMVSGLSIDGRLWGTQAIEPLGFTPIAMKNDGHEFYFVSLSTNSGILRFRLAAFPFPNGGPALPFPDDSLDLLLLDEVATGSDWNPMSEGDAPAPPGPRPNREPATLAGLTLEMHRHAATVWAEWLTDHETVQWVAFRDREVIGRGEQPLRNRNQVAQARARIRRLVEDL